MKQFPLITEITPDVLHGSMDAHAERVSIGFGQFLHDYKAVIFDAFDGPLKVYQKDGVQYTIEQLYTKFINEITCKNVKKVASANSMQKPENQ